MNFGRKRKQRENKNLKSSVLEWRMIRSFMTNTGEIRKKQEKKLTIVMTILAKNGAGTGIKRIEMPLWVILALTLRIRRK